MSAPMRVDRLSIVVPAFNEETRLPATLERLAAFATAHLEAAEIIVVDDGSRDRTRARAEELVQGLTNEKVRLAVLGLPENRGKGAAVREGMLAAREPFVLMSDADLSTPIEELPALADALEGFDVVLGSRAARGAKITQRQPLYRELMGKTFNKLVRVLVTGGIADTQCGFKLFRREAAQAIFSRAKVDRFAFDVEALFLARKLGFRICEVPVRWHNSPATTVHALRDSSRMFADLLRIRRLHRDL
jgi:dolichyl-phosphate beta-glucosyltransferase